MKLTASVLALALGFAAPAAADIVVTASTAPSLSPGRLLTPDAALLLSEGEAVTLFGPNGPVEIKGPFTGAVSVAMGAETGASSAVAALLKRRKRIASLAATRSATSLPEERMTALLHLLADGVWCVDGPPPELFIRAEKRPRVVRLIGADGTRHEILWPANVAAMDWPADAPFAPGVAYRLEVGDIPMPAGLTLAPGGGADDGARLEAYLTHGCAAQADALIAKLAGE